MVDKNKLVERVDDVDDGKNTKNSLKKYENGDKLSPLSNNKVQPEDDYDLVPPDGGWGWLVLFGATLVNLLVPGTIKSFGVLFIEFMEAFKATPSEASWIPALCYFLYSSLGPVSSILSVKYSYRTVTILGGTSAAAGMMLSYWATSVNYLYLSYGVLVGIGAGLSFPPTVYVVTSYFVKLRGLANGVCISGSAFGSIILPPILRFFLEKFGYREAVLIMGALTLNCWVAAIFYDPVEKHMKRVPKKHKVLEDIQEEEDLGIIMKFESEDENPELKSLVTSEENIKSPHKMNDTTANDIPNISTDSNNFIRSASAAVVQNVHRHGAGGGVGGEDHHRTRKISTPIKIPQRNQTFTTSQLCSTPSLYAVPEGGLSNNKLSRSNILRQSKNRLQKRSPSTSSFQYISTPYHGSTLSFQPKEFSSHLSLKSITSGTRQQQQQQQQHDKSRTVDGEKTDKKEETPSKNKFFDLSLLKDYVYLIILISNCTNAISYTNFIILLPAYGLELGYDKDAASYLISIVSMTDLVGRIGGSALSDLNFIPKTWYFVGGLALSGISLALLPISGSYTSVSVICSIFGLASGTYVGITAVIMADLLGEKRLTSSYGISLFVNGVLQLVGPPICGAWFESSNSFAPIFMTLGFVLQGGAALWILMPFVNKNKKRNIAKNNVVENGLLESA